LKHSFRTSRSLSVLCSAGAPMIVKSRSQQLN
jgi:hypothetical protein